MEDFDKVMDRIRKLLDRANHPTTPGPEADLCRSRAEYLMLKHRIEEAIVFEKGLGETKGLEPTWLKIRTGVIGSDYSRYQSSIAGIILRHTGTKGTLFYDWTSDDGVGYVVMDTCGFASDLRYLDLLLTTCLLEFSLRLEPKYDPGLSDMENAWNLRSAGWERKRIAKVMFGDWNTVNEMKAKNRKVTRLIKEYGEKNDEMTEAMSMLGRGNVMASYRESFAEGFVSTLRNRLYGMRQAAQEQARQEGMLVPIGRVEAVQEAFWTKYPTQRPAEPDPNASSSYVDRANCPKCAKAKSGYCRDHAYLKPTYVYDRTNRNGERAGSAAAYKVDLGPGERRLS